MKQNLQFKATQHLSLTPQLQQSIKLLQMSSVELNQELEILIQKNPLIEIIEEEDEEEQEVPPKSTEVTVTSTTLSIPAPMAEKEELEIVDHECGQAPAPHGPSHQYRPDGQQEGDGGQYGDEIITSERDEIFHKTG